MAGQLEGKVAIVTGGASGIGLATVKKFVAEGAKVIFADIQDDLGSAIESELGANAVYVHTDVTSESEIEALVAAAVARFGKLDVMFNNAGAQGDPSPMDSLSSDGFDKASALLVRSTRGRNCFSLMRPPAPSMPRPSKRSCRRWPNSKVKSQRSPWPIDLPLCAIAISSSSWRTA